jgi:hypothetical protein
MRDADVLYSERATPAQREAAREAALAYQRTVENGDGPAQTDRAIRRAEELARERVYEERFGSKRESYNPYAGSGR